SYCLREYAAMEELEQKRFQKGGVKDKRRGLIIPIVFRGPEYLPPTIKDQRQCYDFSRFTLADTRIGNNPAYVTQIEEIAQRVFKFYRDFKDQELSGQDVCSDCSSFSLPAPEQLQPWRDKARPPIPPLPGRIGNG